MLWTRRMFIKHFSLIFVVSQTTKVRYFVIYSPFFPVRCFRRSLKDLHLTSKNMVDLKCSTYPIFSKFWPWICWILFRNMHIKVLITHPAPLILIHCNSANTHGRGYWRWLDHGRCRGFVVHPAFSEFPLTRTPRSEMRFHCPRLYSFLSCKRAALQVTGLLVRPPTQAQGTVGVPETSAPLQPPGWACSVLEVWGGKTWIRTLQSTLVSYLFPLSTCRFLSPSQHSFFWCAAKRFRSEWVTQDLWKKIICLCMAYSEKSELSSTKT